LDRLCKYLLEERSLLGAIASMMQKITPPQMRRVVRWNGYVSRVWEDKQMTEEISLPSQFTHSIKLEETAKGVRVTVHVYANDRETAINQAIQTYDLAKRGLENMKIPLAAMELIEKK
jgi:hypothetical protein